MGARSKTRATTAARGKVTRSHESHTNGLIVLVGCTDHLTDTGASNNLITEAQATGRKVKRRPYRIAAQADRLGAVGGAVGK